MLEPADAWITGTLAAFVALDWAVLGGYFVLLIGASLYFTRRGQQTTDDYFLAGRRMPAWAAAMSVMATSLSAATFIGAPEQSYKGDLTYLTSYLGLILAAIIVAVFFIPAFYRANVSTVYQLLEVRYGKPAKIVASAMFMLGRVLASGARLYIGAIAGAIMLFGVADPREVSVAIAIIAVIGIAYTFVGGIEAVVWTDVMQSIVFVGAAVVAIILLLTVIPVNPDRLVYELRHPIRPEHVAIPSVGSLDDLRSAESKLTMVRSGVDFDDPATMFSADNAFGLLSIVFGFTLIGIGSYGTDQDLTQRMLTCKSARSAGWSAVSGVAISAPVAALFLVVGLLLHIFYDRPGLMGAAAPHALPAKSSDVFITFILNQMPAGVSGLMMAGLFAAALSSLNSELNAMSSTLINDIYRELRPGRDERHYLRVGRTGVIGWGVALATFAVLCAFWQHAGGQKLINFALGVMTFVYSGLVAVFLTALFTRRGTTASVMVAFAVGFASVLLLNWQPWVAAFGWPALDIAFTWIMFIATALALVACCLPASRNPVKV